MRNSQGSTIEKISPLTEKDIKNLVLKKQTTSGLTNTSSPISAKKTAMKRKLENGMRTLVEIKAAVTKLLSISF